ncbi:MAG TPA: condensation domain-containing protein, partial [Pyrinomonadaceae bacterium]
TTYSTWCEVGRGGGAVLIGRPVSNTRAYVLGAGLRPAPWGAPGELYLGGEGLARGYLGRADLTAERFVPDPVSGEPGARLYRTGDVARQVRGGELEYLGRVDHQVKVRGFRIELGEVEATLLRHPSVRAVVVVAREEAGGGQRLVGYVVPDGAQTLTAPELRAHLRESLPEYMVPAAFVFLEALPLTPNGKVDRKALPEPDASTSSDSYVAPRTPVEEAMAGLWSEVLGAKQVGAEDNFFDLGGHSLLATQLVSRMREAFGVSLQLRDLFESPTVSEVARQVEQELKASRGLSQRPIPRVPRDAELPLSYAQQQMWLLHQLEPSNASYNLPRAVRFDGRLDLNSLQNALTEVTGRHESLRTSFAVVDGRPVQSISDEARPLLNFIDLGLLDEESREAEASRLALEEAQRPFDLARAPLLRTTVVRLGALEHIVLLTVHHIVSDGWSMDVLLRELTALYEGFSAGAGSPLQELPIQFADYAHWQRNADAELAAQLEYWKRQLGGRLEAIRLSGEPAGRAAHSEWGERVTLTLPPELAHALKSLGRREGATLFMTMLAAFKVLLRYAAGVEDLAVGTNAANRNRRETEGLVGLLVNQLVLRTRLTGGLTFREALGRVRQVALDAYLHQDVPFEKVDAALRPAQKGARAPLFRVKFDVLHAQPRSRELADVTLTPVGIEKVAARYDLHLLVAEDGDALACSFVYSPALLGTAAVERLAGLYLKLLRRATEEPDVTLAALAAELAAEERHEEERRESELRAEGARRLKGLKRRGAAGREAAEGIR